MNPPDSCAAQRTLSMSLTSSSRSSSATASGLPDAALGTVSPGRNEDLPVPAQEMCVHAQGLKTTQGGQGPRDDGPAPVAFCMPRRHRHPGLHCFRRSIPRLYAPLSTLRVLPRGSVPRMNSGSVWIATPSLQRTFTIYLLPIFPAHRGSMAGLYIPLPTLRRRPCGRLRTAQGRCGSLLLHRKGLAPSTSCRSPGALRNPSQKRSFDRSSALRTALIRVTPPYEALQSSALRLIVRLGRSTSK